MGDANNKVTKEEINIARNACLYDFVLENFPVDVCKEGSNWLRFLPNPSICISRTGWCGYQDMSVSGKHGNPIEFLTDVMGFEFVEAVQMLCGYEITHPASSHKNSSISPKSPIFATACPNAKQVLAYLSTTRGLDYALLQELIADGLLYQDDRKNAVFVNAAKTWGEVRGTNTFVEKRCINAKDCPIYLSACHGWCAHMDTCHDHKKNAYHGTVANAAHDGYWCFPANPDRAKPAFVCESAIDALSLFMLRSKDRNAAYISIGGAGKQAAIDRLKKEYDQVILAVDNDAAGEECRKRNPDLKAIIPDRKDWNEEWTTPEEEE